MMKVVVEIPEAAQGALPPTATLSRDLLEAYAVEHYRKGALTQRQVGLLLGLDRWSTEEFLDLHQVRHMLTLADYEFERATRAKGR